MNNLSQEKKEKISAIFFIILGLFILNSAIQDIFTNSIQKKKRDLNNETIAYDMTYTPIVDKKGNKSYKLTYYYKDNDISYTCKKDSDWIPDEYKSTIYYNDIHTDCFVKKEKKGVAIIIDIILIAISIYPIYMSIKLFKKMKLEKSNI